MAAASGAPTKVFLLQLPPPVEKSWIFIEPAASATDRWSLRLPKVGWQRAAAGAKRARSPTAAAPATATNSKGQEIVPAGTTKLVPRHQSALAARVQQPPGGGGGGGGRTAPPPSPDRKFL